MKSQKVSLPRKRLAALLACIVCVMCALPLHAQNQKCLVAFNVVDAITYDELTDARISLRYEDNDSVACTAVNFNEDFLSLEFPYRPGKYTIVAEREGYERGTQTFTVAAYRNSIITAGAVKLTKTRNQTLGEVTVKATHIKMVMRGDTIVYDAAAFDLAEGSMLDALVAQLPGAELRDGQIYVNGKFIESLLLNGEDFFAGNPSVALGNLPSYTVKQIKVYDRADDDAYLQSTIAQMADTEEHMVMDVILKKAYSTGWLGNVDVGYGLPDNKYQGRTFGLGYTDKLRLAAFVNANDIKDTQTVNSDGNWGGGWAQEGELDLVTGGLDILYHKDRLEYTGNVTLNHERAFVEKKTSTVDFYNTGDIYGRSHSVSRERKFHLMSSHALHYTAEHFYAELRPSVDYLYNDYSTLSRQASFTENPVEDYRMQSLDSIFGTAASSSRYVASLLNRQLRDTEGEKSWISAGATAKAVVQFPNLGDNLTLAAGGNYRRDTDRPVLSYSRAYGPQSDVAGTGEARQQMTDNVSNTYTLNAEVAYKWNYTPYRADHINALRIEPSFRYNRAHSDRDNTLSQRYESLTTDAISQPTVPPSAISRENLAVDLENTYNSILTQDTYTPGVEISYLHLPSAKMDHQLLVVLSVNDAMKHEHLDYRKAGADTILTRFSHSVSPSLKLTYNVLKTHVRYGFRAGYDYSEDLPSIYNNVRTVNSADPSNVYTANAALQRPQTHSVNAVFQYYAVQTERALSVSANYSRTQRAVANARYYDRNTGVSTWHPENINGNWNATGAVDYSMPFGKEQAFWLSSNTNVNFVNSADYSSQDEAPVRSVVKNLTLSEKLSLSYKLGRHTLSWQGNVSLLRSRSQEDLFDDINALNLSTGLTGTFNLPANWQMGTDLSLYCRRGYTDETLNTTNWVWNAFIAKSVMKGNLTFKLNAVDILDDISNVQHTVNAQGRTETWVNSLSRYVMLHVTWRFNVIPKKKADAE